MMRSTSRSFTLVELMAAMTVLSLLMVALVAMFDQAMRGWRNAQKGIDGRREARVALQMVQRDLSGLVVLPGRGIFNETTNNSGKNSDLYFLTTLPSSMQASPTNVGDIFGVGYFVEWDPALNEGRGSRVLRRYQQEAAQQFALLQSAPTSNPARTQLFPPSGSGITVETLAQNVSHFRAEIYQWTNNSNFQSTGGEDGIRRPAYVMVELAAYDPQTVRSFSSQSDWDKSNNVTKYARTYIWRVVP
jgi:type II secretory pathway pseudopilin PulG